MFARLIVTTINKTNYEQLVVVEPRGNEWDLWNYNTPSTVMVNNSNDINKKNNYIWPQIMEYQKDHDMLLWKYRSWLGTCTHMRRD